MRSSRGLWNTFTRVRRSWPSDCHHNIQKNKRKQNVFLFFLSGILIGTVIPTKKDEMNGLIVLSLRTGSLLYHESQADYFGLTRRTTTAATTTTASSTDNCYAEYLFRNEAVQPAPKPTTTATTATSTSEEDAHHLCNWIYALLLNSSSLLLQTPATTTKGSKKNSSSTSSTLSSTTANATDNARRIGLTSAAMGASTVYFAQHGALPIACALVLRSGMGDAAGRHLSAQIMAAFAAGYDKVVRAKGQNQADRKLYMSFGKTASAIFQSFPSFIQSQLLLMQANHFPPWLYISK
jgi:hypothetical protein